MSTIQAIQDALEAYTASLEEQRKTSASSFVSAAPGGTKGPARKETEEYLGVLKPHIDRLGALL